MMKEEAEAGDSENNGGMGGPALFWADLYNFTFLHSGSRRPRSRLLSSQENVLGTKRKCQLDTKRVI
jgi:hypothetical protein